VKVLDGLRIQKASIGLLLRKSPWDPALTYRALTDRAAVDFFAVPRGSGFGWCGGDAIES